MICAGGVGGVFHGGTLKLKNSVMVFCAASRFVRAVKPKRVFDQFQDRCGVHDRVRDVVLFRVRRYDDQRQPIAGVGEIAIGPGRSWCKCRRAANPSA